MALTAETIISGYLDALKAELQCISSENGWFLATPFVRPDGEGIEIELRILPNGHISITDMGDTLGYLYVNGMTLNEPLVSSARQIAKSHGIYLEHSELSVEVEPGAIGSAIRDMIQAALSVSDLVQNQRLASNVRFDDAVATV